jgi:hypothetical protein
VTAEKIVGDLAARHDQKKIEKNFENRSRRAFGLKNSRVACAPLRGEGAGEDSFEPPFEARLRPQLRVSESSENGLWPAARFE